MSVKLTSCGVLVTDGERLLLGHATRSPRWDIPKGVAEPGEEFVAAARRELEEETGLVAAEAALIPLGVHTYLRGKDLALFGWLPEAMPDPRQLFCRTHFLLGGHLVPEFDRFGLFERDDALARLGKNMARILAGIPFDPLYPAPYPASG